MTMDRFATRDGVATMKAVVTTGNGGFDKLVYRDVPIPFLGLARFSSASSPRRKQHRDQHQAWLVFFGGHEQHARNRRGVSRREAPRRVECGDPLPIYPGHRLLWPRRLRTGRGRDESCRRRVLIRPCMRPQGFTSMENIWMASDFDGAFAQYVKAPASEVFPVSCDWTDEELATIPCAYGTAEKHAESRPADTWRACPGHGCLRWCGVGDGSTGQAARCIGHGNRRSGQDGSGAGAWMRPRDLPRRRSVQTLGQESVDLVVDNVAGAGFGAMIKLLKRGGRYVTSGAIAGPVVRFDLRDFYLKDLTLIGCTAWDEPVFPNLVSYIERGEIRPLLAGVFPLQDIVAAQREFLEKRHVGKLVLVPPLPD